MTKESLLLRQSAEKALAKKMCYILDEIICSDKYESCKDCAINEEFKRTRKQERTATLEEIKNKVELISDLLLWIEQHLKEAKGVD